jgi:hypothetical protein
MALSGSLRGRLRRNKETCMSNDGSGNGVPRWVFFVGAIIVLNVLSQAFHWGFIFY